MACTHPSRHAGHHAGLATAVLLLLLAPACASSPEVRVSRDSTADFSRYATYSWLPIPREHERAVSEAERELSRSVQQEIRRELFERGFRYRPSDADLGIGARLAVDREERHITRGTAIETLSSHHDSPSFEVQGTVDDVEIFERGRLTILVVDRRLDREVWRGEYDGRFRDAFAPHAREAVATTLESLPSTPSRGAHPRALERN